jgi:hypothetical protein
MGCLGAAHHNVGADIEALPIRRRDLGLDAQDMWRLAFLGPGDPPGGCAKKYAPATLSGWTELEGRPDGCKAGTGPAEPGAATDLQDVSHVSHLGAQNL